MDVWFYTTIQSPRRLPILTMEILILVGGLYALYTVGMAIATELDYREVNKKDS